MEELDLDMNVYYEDRNWKVVAKRLKELGFATADEEFLELANYFQQKKEE